MTSDYCHSSLNDSQMVINELLKHLLQALWKNDCNEEDEQITVDKSRPSGSWSLRRFPFVDGIIHLSKFYCVLCALSIVQMCKCANVQAYIAWKYLTDLFPVDQTTCLTLRSIRWFALR